MKHSLVDRVLGVERMGQLENASLLMGFFSSISEDQGKGPGNK